MSLGEEDQSEGLTERQKRLRPASWRGNRRPGHSVKDCTVPNSKRRNTRQVQSVIRAIGRPLVTGWPRDGLWFFQTHHNE
jgi:hypothetical protein